MDYRKHLHPASFRGFAFAVERDDETFSRRVKKHAIQNKDLPYHEDLGGDAQPFTVEAVIGGPDYVAKSESFRKLLLQPGAGKLVLPHQGEVTAIVIQARRKHNDKEVGIIRFSITFERSDTAAKGQGNGQTIHDIRQSVSGSHKALNADFITHYISNAPDFVLADTATRLGDFTDRLKGSLSSIQSLMNMPEISVHSALELATGVYPLYG